MNPLPDCDTASYFIRTSSQPEHWAWADSLANPPGDHHVETSLWIHVEVCLGWEGYAACGPEDWRLE